MEEGVRQAYTCCDVAARAPLGTPCWSCQKVGDVINLETVDKFHPWNRPWSLPKQTAENCYV